MDRHAAFFTLATILSAAACASENSSSTSPTPTDTSATTTSAETPKPPDTSAAPTTSSPPPPASASAAPSSSATAKACGGVGGIQCPPGTTCKMPDPPNHPDEMGTCVKAANGKLGGMCG